MKKAARITSKGQITVPHEMRRALGVRPGDKLLFERDGVGVRVRPVRAKSPFEKYRGIKLGTATFGEEESLVGPGTALPCQL